MKDVVIKSVRTWREIEHNRGKIIEGRDDFFNLIIRAAPENYDYSNWTRSDLQDLADSINRILKITKESPNDQQT